MSYNRIMKKSLIAINFDECILKKGKVPFLTWIILKELLKNGHIVVFLTELSIEESFKYLKKWHLFNYPFIPYNGAGIFYINKRKFVTKCLFNEINLKELNDFLYHNKSNIESCTLFFENEQKTLSEFTKNTIDSKPFRVIINVNQKDKIKTSLTKYKYLNFQEINTHSYEIRSSKSNSLEYILMLQKKYKIIDENVLCFGNSISDLDLLMHYHNVYKMQNSPLKNNINTTESDINHNGVVKTLVKKHSDLF